MFVQFPKFSVRNLSPYVYPLMGGGSLDKEFPFIDIGVFNDEVIIWVKSSSIKNHVVISLFQKSEKIKIDPGADSKQRPVSNDNKLNNLVNHNDLEEKEDESEEEEEKKINQSSKNATKNTKSSFIGSFSFVIGDVVGNSNPSLSSTHINQNSSSLSFSSFSFPFSETKYVHFYLSSNPLVKDTDFLIEQFIENCKSSDLEVPSLLPPTPSEKEIKRKLKRERERILREDKLRRKKEREKEKLLMEQDKRLRKSKSSQELRNRKEKSRKGEGGGL
jgi:hypothetical protein